LFAIPQEPLIGVALTLTVASSDTVAPLGLVQSSLNVLVLTIGPLDTFEELPPLFQLPAGILVPVHVMGPTPDIFQLSNDDAPDNTDRGLASTLIVGGFGLLNAEQLTSL
jgi:hypothetical protein